MHGHSGLSIVAAATLVTAGTGIRTAAGAAAGDGPVPPQRGGPIQRSQGSSRPSPESPTWGGTWTEGPFSEDSLDTKPPLRTPPEHLEANFSWEPEGRRTSRTGGSIGVSRARRVRRRGFIGPKAVARGDTRPGGGCQSGTDSVAAAEMIRGGGGGRAGVRRWFGGRSSDDGRYDEFPDDFDYDSAADDDEDENSSSNAGDGNSALFCWPEDEEEAAALLAQDGADSISELELKDGISLAAESSLFQQQQEQGTGSGSTSRGRPDRTRVSGAGFRKSRVGGEERRAATASGPSLGGGTAAAAAAAAASPALKSSTAGSAPLRLLTNPAEDEFTPPSAEPPAARGELEIVPPDDGDEPRPGGRWQRQRSVLGAVVSALMGALGLKLWEGLVRGGASAAAAAAAAAAEVERGVSRGGAEEEEEEAAVAAAMEEEAALQQEKILALENHLAYLEEDRRRAALSAKEARSNRRKDDRQLKEYVHTLEVHLDQLSKEKQESETAMLEAVRAETTKALKQGSHATAAAAAAADEEVRQARAELEAAQALLEEALKEKAVAVQEKAAGDALLRTEQGKRAALEKEVERLKESTSTLTQRLLDAVAKADRADEKERDAATAKAVAEREEIEAAVAAARGEETARCREEFYSALAEEKEKLRKQMEVRLATMRAGLKRRLQEARSERRGTTGSVSGRPMSGGITAGGTASERPTSGRTTGSGNSSGSSSPPE
ncbi:unnamed protein product [Ectocarpus sp. 12 AP-2014]